MRGLVAVAGLGVASAQAARLPCLSLKPCPGVDLVATHRQADCASWKLQPNFQRPTWFSRESGSQPATEHTRPTSGATSLTFRSRTTNMTGGPTLRTRRRVAERESRAGG